MCCLIRTIFIGDNSIFSGNSTYLFNWSIFVLYPYNLPQHDSFRFDPQGIAPSPGFLPAQTHWSDEEEEWKRGGQLHHCSHTPNPRPQLLWSLSCNQSFFPSSSLPLPPSPHSSLLWWLVPIIFSEWYFISFQLHCWGTWRQIVANILLKKSMVRKTLN